MHAASGHDETMIHLPQSVRAWNSSRFKDVLRQEIEQLGSSQLPLQQGVTTTSYALDGPFQVMVISVAEAPEFIHVKVGVFFSGIIAGCSCADDPTPVEPQSEYCELRFSIDKRTAQAKVTTIAD